MTAARIILWRHGRTEWNVENRFQGQADIPLDSVGRAQAERTASMLAGYRPSALYSSDLSRAYNTAAALAAIIGLEIQTDKRLREINVGSWEGLLGREVDAANPELARRLRAGEYVRRSPTGVVATRGLSCRVGACRFVGLPFESWRLMGGLSNCAWVSIDRHRSGVYWRIEAYNALATADGLEAIS